MCQIKPYPWRRNFSLVVRYSLKFARRSLLVVKSLVARCKIPWLLVAEVAHCKKSPVTRCKICSLLVAEVAHCKKSVVTRCRFCSLLVAKVARYKKIVRYSFRNLLVTRWRSCSFQQITGFAMQNSLDTLCKKSFFVKRIARWNYCLFKVNKVR